jgi:poly-gamma-glutamate synthesis protein (capsule biosynthesis protein)
MLARVQCLDSGQIKAGFIPVYVEPPGRPMLADAAFGRKVIDYITRISERAGLPSLSLTQRDDMVVIA